MTLEDRLNFLEKRVAKIEQQLNVSQYSDDLDEKFNEACHWLLQYDKASASMIQRRLGIGYARAARILDQLEEQELVSMADGSKPRNVNREKVEEYLKEKDQLN